MAPVIDALRRRQPQIETIVCATAQHREMQDQALAAFGIEPDVDLNLMRVGQSLDDIVGGVVTAMAPVLADQRPDWLLVQGDTSTAFAAAVAAFHHRIQIGHVEAGLRTGCLDLPFPEEGNRAMLARITDMHFAPTAMAAEALLDEGIDPARVHITGNTVVDALHRQLAGPAPLLPEWLNETLESPTVLVTGHRRESLGVGLEAICQAVARLARIHPNHRFVYPLHLNPKVRAPARRILGDLANVTLCEPLDHATFLASLVKAALVITDSGGVQEEAAVLGIPTLVTREVTERREAIVAGIAALVGTDVERIVAEGSRLLLVPDPGRSARARDLFGDGKAAERIADLLVNSVDLSEQTLEWMAVAP